MTAQTLSVNVEQDRAVVALSGEHEAYTADKLARHLSALLEEGVGVTVDLRRATFIDSTVIGVLIATHRRASEAGLDLVVLVGDETGWPVRRLLEVTRLAARLDVVEWPTSSQRRPSHETYVEEPDSVSAEPGSRVSALGCERPNLVRSRANQVRLSD
jgi:anti-anti-sigma factor